MNKPKEGKLGRPSAFSQKIADSICERLADGESLRSICAGEDMPNRATVFRWLADKDRQVFRDQYARAREIQADTLFEEILEIADESSKDTIVKSNRDGSDAHETANNEWISRSRLRVDARKWMASKLAPKKYGDKLDVGIGGIEGAPAVTVKVVKSEAK